MLAPWYEYSLASTGKYKVKALVRNLEKAKEVLAEGLGPNLELVQGNIVDEDSLNAAMEVNTYCCSLMMTFCVSCFFLLSGERFSVLLLLILFCV